MEKRQYTAEYKAKIVLEILAEKTSISEIARRKSFSQTQLQNWKKEFVENSARIFSQIKIERASATRVRETQERNQSLMARVGQLTIENDWLKKICPNTRSRLGEEIWSQEPIS